MVFLKMSRMFVTYDCPYNNDEYLCGRYMGLTRPQDTFEMCFLMSEYPKTSEPRNPEPRNHDNRSSTLQKHVFWDWNLPIKIYMTSIHYEDIILGLTEVWYQTITALSHCQETNVIRQCSFLCSFCVLLLSAKCVRVRRCSQIRSC